MISVVVAEKKAQELNKVQPWVEEVSRVLNLHREDNLVGVSRGHVDRCCRSYTVGNQTFHVD